MAFNLAVLNPGGRDPEQHFPGGAGTPDAPGAPHSPTNYHAYAACTDGSFHARLDRTLATGRPVLLLLRQDLGTGLRTLRRLQKAGRTTVITFKEAGAGQIAARLVRSADLKLLGLLLSEADGLLAPTSALADFLNHARPLTGPSSDVPAVFIPTPYPVDDPRWDFSVQPEKRRGVFVGTREFGVPSRQHLAALYAARRIHALTGEPVTVLNTDGRRGLKNLAALGFSQGPDAALRAVQGPQPYTEYLRIMARHRLVFQLDRSVVPGQVAGDALLCRMPCVGGDGGIERVVFPALAGPDKEPAALVDLAVSLLENPSQYEKACRGAQTIAREAIAFRAVSAQLAEFYAMLEARRRL